MITAHESMPGQGMTFRTVSFQGTQLSDSQRRNIALRQQVQASFLNQHLTAMVDETFAKLEQRKAQGIKPERVWFPDRTEKGTPFVGDSFGY